MNRRLFLIGAMALFGACGPGSQLPVDSPLDEEVNVGYGTTSRRDLTVAVDKVKVDERVVVTYTSIAEYLRGRVAGVIVNPNGWLVTGNVTASTSSPLCSP